MGSCCTKNVEFSSGVRKDLKWRCYNLPSCKDLLRRPSDQFSENDESNGEIPTQTEQLVFKLLAQGNDFNLQRVKNTYTDRGPARRGRGCSGPNLIDSMIANASQGSLVSARMSSAGTLADGTSTRSMEQILSVIERVQDICGRVSIKDQVSLLCTVSYLREFCVYLNERNTNSKLKKRPSVEEMKRNADVEYWMSTYNGRKKSENGMKRFKKIGWAVKTAITIAGMSKNVKGFEFHADPTVGVQASCSGAGPEVGQYLKEHLTSWHFDQFEFDRITNNHGISVLFCAILRDSGLSSEFNIDNVTLTKYCLAIEQGYSKYKNPYHNELHGADVLQTTYFLVQDTKIRDWLSSLELLAILFAAMIHDLEHTGTTNVFHNQCGSALALLYNDKSVLENHHVARAFQLHSQDGMNPLASLSAGQFRTFRQSVVECVLATDMAVHFQQINTLKNSVIDISLIERQDLMNSLLHCADISGPAKPWAIHESWTLKLMDEFFAQGDREREMGMAVSPLCDRNTTNIPESQVGFITYITVPAFHALGNTIDAVLRDKQEAQFLEKSARAPVSGKRRGSRAASGDRRRSSLAAVRAPGQGHLPPVEVAGDVSAMAPGTEPPPTFLYDPIHRVWDKNFEYNRSRWQDRLAGKDDAGYLNFDMKLTEKDTATPEP